MGEQRRLVKQCAELDNELQLLSVEKANSDQEHMVEQQRLVNRCAELASDLKLSIEKERSEEERLSTHVVLLEKELELTKERLTSLADCVAVLEKELESTIEKNGIEKEHLAECNSRLE